MIIGIDYDDTLVDNQAVAIAAKNLGITDYPKNYNYGLLELTEEHRLETWRLFTNYVYMNNLKPIPGAVDQLYKWRNKGHKIVVITARGKNLEFGTRVAIEDDFPIVDKILFVDNLEDDKTKLMKQEGINVWIDDREYSALASLKAGIETYLICNDHTLHNRESRPLFGDHAVNNIADIKFDTIELNCYHCQARLKPTVYDLKDRLGRTFIECKYCNKPVNVLSGIIPDNWKYILYKD